MKEDLARVFGPRLLSLVSYGDRRSMAVVSTLTAADLAALMPLVPRWRAAGAGVPLLLTRRELERTLDIFPIEYGAILASHELVAGADPFAGLTIAPEHLRQATERQVKSHLIHLREGLLETGGRPAALTDLVQSSAPAFRAVLQAVARLFDDGRRTPASREVPAAAVSLLDDEALARFAESTLGLPGDAVRDVIGADRGRPIDAQALVPGYLALAERLWTIVDTWHG